jgi:hypothetical protein
MSLAPYSIHSQAQHPPNPSPIISSEPLPPPRTSIIDTYRCDYLQHHARFVSTCPPSCSENSDHDATLDITHPHGDIGEAGKGCGLLKQRRQQKRLEVIFTCSINSWSSLCSVCKSRQKTKSTRSNHCERQARRRRCGSYRVES